MSNVFAKITPKSAGNSKGRFVKSRENLYAEKSYFVAGKNGKMFHVKNCPKAKQIPVAQLLTFKSKTSALDRGFIACKCTE